MPLFMGVVCRAERIGGFGNVEGYKGRDIDGGRTVIAPALSPVARLLRALRLPRYILILLLPLHPPPPPNSTVEAGNIDGRAVKLNSRLLSRFTNTSQSNFHVCCRFTNASINCFSRCLLNNTFAHFLILQQLLTYIYYFMFTQN